jgi:hypothetical protein
MVATTSFQRRETTNSHAALGIEIWNMEGQVRRQLVACEFDSDGLATRVNSRNRLQRAQRDGPWPEVMNHFVFGVQQRNFQNAGAEADVSLNGQRQPVTAGHYGAAGLRGMHDALQHERAVVFGG